MAEEDPHITLVEEPEGKPTEQAVLQFENARVLSALCANDLGLLKVLEEKTGVKTTTREGWIKLDGDPANVERARRVFAQLDEARLNGVVIRKQEFLVRAPVRDGAWCGGNAGPAHAFQRENPH